MKCSHTGSTDHCDHSLDAGVRCIPGGKDRDKLWIKIIFFVLDECNTTGALRIVSESSPLKGRVEVCIYGVWGTIESTFWDIADARLVCRVLGYSPISKIRDVCVVRGKWYCWIERIDWHWRILLSDISSDLIGADVLITVMCYCNLYP